MRSNKIKEGNVVVHMGNFDQGGKPGGFEIYDEAQEQYFKVKGVSKTIIHGTGRLKNNTSRYRVS